MGEFGFSGYFVEFIQELGGEHSFGEIPSNNESDDIDNVIETTNVGDEFEEIP